MKFTRFVAEESIGYQFVKSVSGSSDLVVVFPGQRDTNRKPWPEYVIELSSCQANKLFIVDDVRDVTVAPFILLEGEYRLERSIKGLIDKIITENGIENVTIAGASGGGSAAIYYGFKYNWNIIAASPCIFYDSEMTYNTEERTKLLLGNREDKSILRKMISDVVECRIEEYTKKIWISYGKEEPSFVSQTGGGKYMKKLLGTRDIQVSFILADFSDHMECIPFLGQHIQKWLEDIFY